MSFNIGCFFDIANQFHAFFAIFTEICRGPASKDLSPRNEKTPGDLSSGAKNDPKIRGQRL